MRILALETVTRRGSVALWDAGVVVARAGGETRTHGARLPGELLALLEERGLRLADVDLFAVISGPGSFTGLRVGMASIQGLALAGHRQVIPIPTLEAMAESWRLGDVLRSPEPSGPGAAGGPEGPPLRSAEPRTLVVPCLDGQRGDVFFAGWEMTEDIPVEQSHQVISAAVGKPEELARRLAAMAGRAFVLVGDGAPRHADAFAGLGGERQDLSHTLAEMAARMAARRLDSAVSPHALRPTYIRRPDAELAREKAALP